MNLFQVLSKLRFLCNSPLNRNVKFIPKWEVWGRGDTWLHSGNQSCEQKLAHTSSERSHILAPHFRRKLFVMKYKDSACVCLCANPLSHTPDCTVTWVPIPSRLVRASTGQLAGLALSSGLGTIVPELTQPASLWSCSKETLSLCSSWRFIKPWLHRIFHSHWHIRAKM